MRATYVASRDTWFMIVASTLLASFDPSIEDWRHSRDDDDDDDDDDDPLDGAALSCRFYFNRRSVLMIPARNSLSEKDH